MSVLQMAGTLLAVPVGIGSAYSMYHANFSAEATCQSLRVNIVAMLNKGVDASTRRILVRRDVEAFEQSCGSVDPEATAAFKALLAADKAPAPAATAQRAEPQPQTEVRKAEPATVAAAKQPVATARVAAPETAAVKREAVTSDAAWFAAVRSALVDHERDQASAATPAAPTALAAPAVPPSMLGELRTPAAPPPTSLAAPALPPATPVATLSAPPVDPDHPVPPAAIPETAPAPDGHTRSRFGVLVEGIPFVGKTIADHVSR